MECFTATESSVRVMALHTPMSYSGLSVTMNARFLPFSSRSATSSAPPLK